MHYEIWMFTPGPFDDYKEWLIKYHFLRQNPGRFNRYAIDKKYCLTFDNRPVLIQNKPGSLVGLFNSMRPSIGGKFLPFDICIICFNVEFDDWN